MSEIHALMVGVAEFLVCDVKGGTTGTVGQTRAELSDVCRALAMASIAESVQSYFGDDTEAGPHLRIVLDDVEATRTGPQPEDDKISEVVETLQACLDKLKAAPD